MKNIDDILENAKNNSIGTEKKNKFIKGTKKISKKALTLLVALVMATSLTACSSYQIIQNEDGNTGIVYSQEYIDYHEGVSSSTGITDRVKEILENYGISPSKLADNDISIYEQIFEISESDLIGYYRLLGESECEKILKVLGYQGWEDYLSVKGYFDENGEPSIAIWEYETYIALGQQVELGGYTK